MMGKMSVLLHWSSCIDNPQLLVVTIYQIYGNVSVYYQKRFGSRTPPRQSVHRPVFTDVN